MNMLKIIIADRTQKTTATTITTCLELRAPPTLARLATLVSDAAILVFWNSLTVVEST